jgi:hypothetical protein
VNKIPDISQFNFPDGVWFIFRDGDRQIAAHNSILGLERIFINGKLASKRRSLARRSSHQFIFEGNIYAVTTIVSKGKNSKTECSLLKDDVCISRSIMHSEINVKKVPLRKQLFVLLLCFPIIMSIGYLAASLGAPLLFPSMMLFLLVVLYTSMFIYIMKKCVRITFEIVGAGGQV